MEFDKSCPVLREYGNEQSLLSRPDGSSTFVQGNVNCHLHQVSRGSCLGLKMFENGCVRSHNM